MSSENSYSFRKFLNGNFAIIYFFIFSVGLLNIIRMTAITIVKPSPTNHLIGWVVNFFNPNKPRDLAEYIISICVMALYYSVLYLMIKNRYVSQMFSKIAESNAAVAGYIVYAVIANMLLIMNPRPGLHNIIPRALIWLISIILPFVINKKYPNVRMLFVYMQNSIKLQILLLMVVAVNILAVIYPFIFEKLKIINEFWDIPEQTIISGQVINNTKYINEHGLTGNNRKYDIEYNDNSSNNNVCFNLTDDKAVNTFIDYQNDLNKLKKRNLYYYYDERNKSLCVNGRMNGDDKSAMESIFTDKIDEINNLYSKSEGFANSFNKNKNTDEKEFVEKNKYEITWQVLNRFWLHHHNHVIGPMNEINYGKNIDDVYMQYGWMDTIVLKNILNYIGGLNYQNYNKVLYSFYYIYYALFICLAFVVLKKTQLVLPFTVLIAAGLNKLSYPFLYIAPGVNPIRHCFDIVIILFFYLFIFTKRNVHKLTYLILILLFSILEILNNRETGLFLLSAIIITLIIKNITCWKDKSIIDIIMTLCIILAGVYAYVSSHVGNDEFVTYFRNGLLGFVLPRYMMIIVMVVIGAFYSVLVRQYKCENKLKHVCLLMFVYSQALLTYFIWGSDLNHFIVYSPIFAFTAMIFVKLVSENSYFCKQNEKYIVNALLLVTLILYVPSIIKYQHNKNDFNNIFKTHTTYEWNLPTGKFISTMNPKYFVDSIDIINKYSSSKGIYIISKYDYFLPFISGKYSSMPYFDLQWYLMSKKEVENCINKILNDKPKHIFVDRDIDRTYENDIINSNTPYGYLYNESVWRVKRLNTLKLVFNSIKKNYTPVKSTYLLTVYEKII